MNGEPDGKDELHLVPFCIVEFHVGVTRCPDGAAQNSTGLNNRGHDDWPEITVWPKHEAHLTTGREYKASGIVAPHPDLNAEEKKICAILGLKEWELHTFLRNWQMIRKSDNYPETAEEVREKLAECNRKEPEKLMVTTLAGFLREHGL